METANKQAQVITSHELLKHWLGHRQLTRRVIEAFPEKEFFEYSIGGMRTAAGLIGELLGIAGPGLQQIVNANTESLNEKFDFGNKKANVLAMWDKADEEITVVRCG